MNQDIKILQQHMFVPATYILPATISPLYIQHTGNTSSSKEDGKDLMILQNAMFNIITFTPCHVPELFPQQEQIYVYISPSCNFWCATTACGVVET